MNIIKKKPSRVFIISLLLVLAAVAVHGDSGKRSLFAVNPNLLSDNYLSDLNNLPVAEQNRPMNVIPWVVSNTFALEVLAGIVGNVALGYAGGCLGYYLFDGKDKDSLSWIGGVLLGFSAGSVVGSSLGVYLVGNSGSARGQFSKALLGSVLGEIVSLGVTLLSQNEGIGLLSMAILPPLFAAINFNRSLRYRNLPAGNGLLNLNKDKLTFGIPDMQIRPQPAYGKNMKTEFGFKINVLSVVL